MLKPVYNFFHRLYHKKYHGIYRHAKKLFIFDLALLGLGIIMLSTGVFFFFWKPGLTNLIDLSISLGSDRIKSGEHVKLTIDYANKSKYELRNVTLALRLPNGFIVDREQTPENIFSKESTFTSPTELKPGAKGQAEIYGWFWSQPNFEQKITASLSYEPENSESQEQKISSYIANLPASTIEGRLEISTTTFPDYPLKFTYTLTNTGSRTIKGIFLSTNGNLSKDIFQEKDQNTTLPANSLKVITGQITTPNKAGEFFISITPQILINNFLVDQMPIRQAIKVISPNLVSSVNFLEGTGYIQPGQIIPLQISWENKSEFKLNNLSLRLKANYPKIIDWTKTARENNAKVDQNGIVFDQKSRTNLSNGNPGSNDKFTINLYFSPSFNLNEIEKTYLEIIPKMEAALNQLATQKFTQEGVKSRIPLATELKLKAEARYYTTEYDQLGRGPLPPRVGKITKYWIFINVSNTSNAVNNASFSALLPAGIELTGKQSVTIGPQLHFDSVSRKITWAYDYLPAYSQTGLYFEVAVTPDSSQIGQNIILVNSLRFSATDDFIGKAFSLTSSQISNVLNVNDKGHNLGSKVTE